MSDQSSESLSKSVLHIIVEYKENEKEEISKTNFWKSNGFFDILKWFFGTLVLGVIGIVINNKIQKTELELKRLEADATLIDAVSKRFDTTDISRYKYLKYIEPF